MAKVQFTAVVSDMRNKLAGTVFSKNRGGAYTRTKVSPINRNTPDQSIVRARLSALSAQWRGLTDTQRNAWNAAAPNFPRTDQFGATFFLSGHQLFISLNTNLSTIAETNILVPPMPVLVPEFSILSANVHFSGVPHHVDITLEDTVPAGFSMVQQATAPQSPGKTFVSNLYRQLNVFAAGTGPVLGSLAAYPAKFGLPPVGQKVGFQLYLINSTTGQAGTAQNILTTVN